jgi:hypothetical protein
MIAENDNKNPGEQESNRDAQGKFKPGMSGNPSGRPKGRISVTRFIRELLAEGDGERARNVAESIIKNAEDGDIRHIAELLQRVDGKVTDKIEAVVTDKLYRNVDTEEV